MGKFKKYIKKWFRTSDIYISTLTILLITLITISTESAFLSVLALIISIFGTCCYPVFKERKDDYTNSIKLDFKLKKNSKNKVYIDLINNSTKICHIFRIGIRGLYSKYDENGVEIKEEKNDQERQSFRIFNNILVNYSNDSKIIGAEFPFKLDNSKRLSIFDLRHVDLSFAIFNIADSKNQYKPKFLRIIVEIVSGNLIESQKFEFDNINEGNFNI